MKKEKIIIKNGNVRHLIDTDNLLAVMADDYICSLYIENGKIFKCVKSLKSILMQLPDHFMQIKRNCIVNTKKLKSMNAKKRTVTVAPGLDFEFSYSNSKQIHAIFSNR